MSKGPKTTLLAVTLLCAAIPALAYGQEIREDVIWARFTSDTITLDGVLDEAAWAQAESKVIEYGVDAGIPGSGWKVESGGLIANDPTYATFKFLCNGNQLYMGAVVQDAYIGGSEEFNRFDGFLMAIKDHLDPFAPKPPVEYFYSWWYADSDPDPQPAGQDPAFVGRYAEWPPGSPRTPEQIAAWDAVTVVEGLSNDDSVLDTSYTVEMRFDLSVIGYDVTQPEGDVVEWNIGLYDCDYFWPFDPLNFTTNRVWWQSPWGNAAWFNEVRIHARPDVTVSSGDVPTVGPDIIIPKLLTTPAIDGELSEDVWDDPSVYAFDIRYGDDALRQTYPATGPYRSGQFQPEIYGGQAFVVDPGDASVKVFFVDDTLYMGFDVNDAVVQYHPDFNRWDGFLVTINDIVERGPDHNLLSRRLGFLVDEDGSALPQDYLATLVQDGLAEVAIALKPGTEVDTLGVPDTGYTAELAVDLTGFSYPSGMVQGTFFFGVTLLDGDSFIPFTDSYGTRTWWFREYENECCPIWSRLAPGEVAVEEFADGNHFGAYGYARSYPNPSLKPRLRFWLPENNHVTLEVYDLRGHLVERRQLGDKSLGEGDIPIFAGKEIGAGMYLYRLKLVDPETGELRSTLTGKTIVVK